MRNLISRRTVSTMTKTLGVGIAAGALVLTGAVAAVATADSRTKNVTCRAISTQVETRAVTRPALGTYTGPSDQTGTQQRTATTSRCRGKLVVTYSAWR